MPNTSNTSSVPRTVASHPLPSDPTMARWSPIGDCPCPERGPRHNGLLIWPHPHPGANTGLTTHGRLRDTPRCRKPTRTSPSPCTRTPFGTCNTRNRKWPPILSRPWPYPLVQEGEVAMSIAHMGACHGKSYSGAIRLTLWIMVRTVH
jgi:hypothetical protein